MPQRRNFEITDRKYMQQKMRLMKQARERGNSAVVRRHANDLIQYFNVDGVSERPIEDILTHFEQKLEEETQMKYDKRFQRLREAVGSQYE